MEQFNSVKTPLPVELNLIRSENMFSLFPVLFQETYSTTLFYVVSRFSFRTHSDQFLVTFKEVGRKPPTFGDASVIALELLNSGYEFDEGSIIFNRFRQEKFRNQSFFMFTFIF